MHNYFGERVTGVVAKDPQVEFYIISPQNDDRSMKAGTIIQINDNIVEVTGTESFLNNFGRRGSKMVVAVKPIRGMNVPENQRRILDL